MVSAGYDVTRDHSLIVATLRDAGCVYAEDEAQLLLDVARTPAELASMVERRVAGLPLEQVVGWAKFFGVEIVVEPGVFVPRRRTEFLVSQAASLATPGAVVLDLCCGSGAVGAALTTVVDRIALYAADIDPVAVRCARRNIAADRVYEGDLFEPVPPSLRGRVDIVVANTPYVPTEEIRLMPPEARLHEPRIALDGGDDGLDIQRRVAAEAPAWLAPGGHLLVETSVRQATQTIGIFTRSRLIPRVANSDEWDATVVIGTMPGLPR